MESPGNGGGSQGQHIHVLLQLLDLFLVGHAEPLLLVDDEQAQVLELHVLGEHPVSADDDVHKPLFQPLQRLFDTPPGCLNRDIRSTRTGKSFILWMKVL